MIGGIGGVRSTLSHSFKAISAFGDVSITLRNFEASTRGIILLAPNDLKFTRDEMTYNSNETN